MVLLDMSNGGRIWQRKNSDIVEKYTDYYFFLMKVIKMIRTV